MRSLQEIVTKGQEKDKAETTYGLEIMGPPLITDHEMNQIHIYMNLILRGLISLIGIISNAINITIFYRMGVKDSMGVGLMTLSVSDFLVTLLGLAGAVCYISDVYYPYGIIDPFSVLYICVGWFKDMFYMTSGWVSTFLFVERSVCVIFPFKVKRIFTKNRCIIAMVTIYMVILAIHMPVYATQWLVWTEIEIRKKNDTEIRKQLVMAFAENREDIDIYIDVTNGSILPIPMQIIAFVSVFLMIYGLRTSSKIRDVNKDLDSGKKQESKLSSKEVRLVKVVLFLAIILSVCNIPRFCAVYSRQIFPEVNVGRQFANLYIFLWNLTAIITIVNSTVNIIIYLIVNANYRKLFWQMFRLKREEGEGAVQ